MSDDGPCECGCPADRFDGHVCADEALLAATTVDGRRRFYPTGEHPATARLRAHADILRRLPEGVHRNEALHYADRMLALFEMGEDRSKLAYLTDRGLT